VVAVHCLHCGARYETDLPVQAVERIRRCARCGRATLVPEREGETEPAATDRER
jgi:DNA-directed RNA polymerase subunit RPC12/RpoP